MSSPVENLTSNQLIMFRGPLYEQVYQMLRTRILAGEWEPREPLPGEAWLSKELAVSIGTIRKAMDQLARENIVVRERGRGTFVRRDAGRQAAAVFRLIDREGCPIVPEIRPQIGGATHAVATDREVAELDMRARYKGAPSVVRLRREWWHDAKRLCRETITVDAARFPRIESVWQEHAQTMFETYASHYRCAVERMLWSIASPEHGPSSAIKGDGRDCSPPKARALRIRRKAYCSRGLPFELCEQVLELDECEAQIWR